MTKGMREKKGERSFYPLAHSPNVCNSQGWPRPRSGNRNSIQKSHVGGWDPRTWAIILCLPRLSNRKMNQKQSSQDSDWHLRMGCRPPLRWLIPLCHNASS